MSLTRCLFGMAAILVALACPVHAGAPSNAAVSTALAAMLAAPGPFVVDDVALDASRLRPLYGEQAPSPLWRHDVDSVTGVLGDAAAEGLDPARYHISAIAARSRADSAQRAAELDLLLSDAVLDYVVDVRFGRGRPSRITDEAAVDPLPDPLPLVHAVATAPDPAGALHDLAPKQPAYRALRDLLGTYRTAFANGERWPVVPDGPKLSPGMRDPSVAAIRARLDASGELPPQARGRSDHYDGALVGAMKEFQDRHGLKPDGVLGARSRAALNVGLAQRIEQIIVNMERWRWLPDDLGPRRVVVNVAAQQLTLIEDGAPILAMPVIVGETDKMTPTFSSEITTVIFNPSWTVPDKIARKELLPKAQRDGQYFARQGIRLIGGWQPVASDADPDGMAGARSAAGFRLRQAPGPQNPLGRVKFFIPNVFGVYLHDTNSKRLFAREGRTLSHGCVRVGNALGLAEQLLTDSGQWNDERRQQVFAEWKTKTVTLKQPMPVHLMYETAWIGADGRAHFVDDVYGRDRRLADRLAGRTVEVATSAPRVAQP